MNPRVLIVGVGGLGCPASAALAADVDPDRVAAGALAAIAVQTLILSPPPFALSLSKGQQPPCAAPDPPPTGGVWLSPSADLGPLDVRCARCR